METFDFLNAVLMASRLFGIAPFTHKLRYQLSRAWQLYSLVFVVTQVVAQVTIMSDIVLRPREVLLQKIYSVISETSFLLALSVQVGSLYHASKMVALLNKLSGTTILNLNHKHSNITDTIIVYFQIITLAAITILSYRCMDSFSIFQSTSHLVKMLSLLRCLVLVLPHSQLIRLLIILRVNFQSINSVMFSHKVLEKLKREYFQSNSLSVGESGSSVVESGSSGVIKILSAYHHSLCELVTDLNHVYNVPVTILVTMVFGQLTVYFYTNARLLMSTNENDLKINVIIALSIWVGFLAMNLTFLLWQCERISSQVCDTPLVWRG